MHILCLNSGSSSLKFAVYRMAQDAEERVFSGAIEAIADHSAAVQSMFAALARQGIRELAAAGHRIVHGGPDFREPRMVDEKLKRALETLVPFAPLHLPGQLAIIAAMAGHYPGLPQAACFDTAFHSSMPEIASRFALPGELWRQGIRRYGFHGLSYEYVTAKLGPELGARAIIAHLGNGASMVALKDGLPLDTSMGLTPAGGFMMGTRSGDLDPGVLLYLLRRGDLGSGDGLGRGGSAEKLEDLINHLEDLINHKAGLLGVSGRSGDMKVLLEGRQSDPAAALAVAMFCYQVRKWIGSFSAVLGGLDTLVFTGGIGERAVPVRAEICAGLEYLGVELDADANRRGADLISHPNARCRVRVIPTDEDLMIARHTRRLLQK
jgi:acetate kinase